MELIDLSGRYKIQRGPLHKDRLDGGAWHHSVTRTPAADWTKAQELAVLDRINAYHLEPHWHNWRGELVSLGGFAYHFAAFPSRRLYLITPLSMRGAHIASHNGHLVAVVLIGTFTTNPPVPAHLETALEARFNIEGWRGLPLEWKGHRAWAEPAYPTACPGNTHQLWVPGISLAQEGRTMYTDAQIDAKFKGLYDRIALLEAPAAKPRPRPAPRPRPGPRYYTVRPNDVASLIAERHGLTWAAFKRLNPKGPRSHRWNLIYKGEKFRVA